MEKEQKIIEQITKSKELSKSFWEIVDGFKSKFPEFNPVDNCFSIEDYFGKRIGKAKAQDNLIRDEKIKKEWLNAEDDFMGIYVFIHERTPFYVGISRGVIGRIIQHTKGHNHNTATLAYKIAKLQQDEKIRDYRKGLDFKKYVDPVKDFLLRQKIALFHIDNPEELYLFEIFCSMELQTHLNNFETH